jgi:methylmalonyl-CoA mutase N-terminal domain/subunit
MAEAGASPAEEIAFAICNALEYIRWAKSAEINVERFLERISFFFCSRTNLLEEIAKFRAARRVWAKIVKSHFAYDESKQKMRFHTQTAGIQLEARNPEFNLIRVTIQALVAILGGSQSIHTNSFDEAISIPSEYSSLIAFETQKIIQRETDICQSIDPMGGSYVIENLTNQMEQHIFEIIHTIENMGGAMSAISAGYQKKVIETNAYNFAMQQETFSDKVFLRSNNARFAMLSEPISKEFTDSGLIIENLGKFKKSRNANLEDDLRRIQKSTRNSSNFFEDLEGAIRNGATIGEVISALKVSLTNP